MSLLSDHFPHCFFTPDLCISNGSSDWSSSTSRKSSWEVPLLTFDLTPSARPSSQFVTWRESCYLQGLHFYTSFPTQITSTKDAAFITPHLSFACTFVAQSSKSCRECDSTNGMKILCMSDLSDTQLFGVIIERSQCECLLQRPEHHVFRRGQFQDSG